MPAIAPATSFSPTLYFDPQMVAELALGADHPHDVAERYGVAAEEYEHLDTLPWFHELVARKRQELQDNGLLFQAKAAMMAETLLTRLFQQSMAAAIPAPLTVEVAKQLTTIGRLAPQPGVLAPGGGGPQFAINIQVNGDIRSLTEQRPPTPTPVIEGMAVPPPSSGASGLDRGPVAAMNLGLPIPSPMAAEPSRVPPDPNPPPPPLPPKPAYVSNIPVPNFDRDLRPRAPALRVSALTGNPTAQAAAASTLPPSTQPSAGAPLTQDASSSRAGPPGVGLPSRSPLG